MMSFEVWAEAEGMWVRVAKDFPNMQLAHDVLGVYLDKGYPADIRIVEE